MELITDFAYPLPVSVFCEMLGIPDEASVRFRSWTAAVAQSLDLVISAEDYDACMALLDEMEGYLSDLAEQRRADPGEDVLSVLAVAEVDGERLSHGELVAQLITLYVAGHEPTSALIGNGMVGLLSHPDQLAKLQADPGLVPSAVQELLRYDGPNQFVRRIATEPMSFDDRVIEPGQVIYVGVGAANHDPARWGDDADAVRIDRADASQHVQFGGGIHHCLGAHLARLQAEVALTALLDAPDRPAPRRRGRVGRAHDPAQRGAGPAHLPSDRGRVLGRVGARVRAPGCGRGQQQLGELGADGSVVGAVRVELALQGDAVGDGQDQRGRGLGCHPLGDGGVGPELADDLAEPAPQRLVERQRAPAVALVAHGQQQGLEVHEGVVACALELVAERGDHRQQPGLGWAGPVEHGQGGRHPPFELAEQGLGQQVVLRPEVVGDGGQVGPRGGGDLAGAGPDEPVAPHAQPGRVEQVLAGRTAGWFCRFTHTNV